MKLGDRFSSYEEFNRVLAVYKKNVQNEFWIRDARTIENQRKRAPESVHNINRSLKYYHMRLACAKGGRAFKSKNQNSKRKCTTYKEDCEATIFLRVTSCKQYLCVLELKDYHNHMSFETYLTNRPHRKQRPENVDCSRELSTAGVTNELTLDRISAEASQKVTLIDLLTNIRVTKGSNEFVNCVNMLKNTYNCCDVQLLTDEDEVFKGLYFQDQRMKRYMETFPEMLLIDGTSNIVDLTTMTYVIMVEDGCGFSEIVAVCLLVDDDESSINLFIKAFKNRNFSWKNVRIVMSDKDKTERKIYEKHFPDAKSMISLVHVFQIFNKEVSFKRMGININEVHTARQYIQKIAYVSSESEYTDIYSDMVRDVPKQVKDYYDSNWNCIIDQWVQYLTLQNICFANKTNNFLETINNKLKNVINKFSFLEDFIKILFVHINNSRVGKDFKNSHILHRKPAKLYDKESPEYYYKEHLTTFAFEKVEKQLNALKDFNHKKLHSIGKDVFLTETLDALIQVTPLSCECLFWKFTQLPCIHIFCCRSKLSLPLFDVDLCVRRWSRLYCVYLLKEFIINENTDQELETDTTANKETEELDCKNPKYIISNNKLKVMEHRGRKLAELCSQVPTPIFYKRLKIIDSIINHWETSRDETLNALFKDILQDDSGNSVDQKITSSITRLGFSEIEDNPESNYEICQNETVIIDMHEVEFEEINDLLEIDNVVVNEMVLDHEEELGPDDIVAINPSNVEDGGSNKKRRPRIYSNAMVGLKRKRFPRE